MRELRLICILVSAIYARVNTSAQAIAGSLRGTIRDTSGGAGDDGLTRPLSSRRVAGGHDRLEAAAKGFKKYVQERGVLQHFQLRLTSGCRTTTSRSPNFGEISEALPGRLEQLALKSVF
jgi:hypothetical protein